MHILETSGWEDYELIDSGNGRRLERFGKSILSRPDPQAIWQPKADLKTWEGADAVFDEKWQIKSDMLSEWILKYKDIKFKAKLTPFKHTGIFPEQRVHWDFLSNELHTLSYTPKVLNLFGYTGISSLVAAKTGATVTHVDASRPAIDWLKENEKLNFDNSPIRVIVDDALKFVEREIKRDNKYDAIIMDPPVYGHSPTGAIWDFNRDFPKLMEGVSKLLSKDPLFVIANTYAVSSSAIMLGNVMNDYLEKLDGPPAQAGKIEVGELALKEKVGKRLLSTGIYAKWEK